tara:strand:- start:16068 stop:17741 length:1674 start_codon:yes stop_codon:yes gene_type:complete
MADYQFDCGCSFSVKDPKHPVTLSQTGLPSIDFKIRESPYNCKMTWDLIKEGKTKGVFQLESNLGKSWAKRIRPNNIEELAALTALIRPGCLKAIIDGKSMTQRYVDRKNGTEEVTYLHDALEPILESTQGVLVYQEQSMQIAQVIAGFDLEQADSLRKAIGKKNATLMSEVKGSFLDGAEDKGLVTREIAEEIFGWIEKSNRYAFNKSHAVSYAICGYWSAYAKAHFPVNFYCNYLYYADGKQDTQSEIREVVSDARIHDVKVASPSIENMNSKFSINGGVIHFGFNDIKSVGAKQVEKLVDAISTVESFLEKPVVDWSWYQFLINASHKINSKVCIALVSVGAFSCFGLSRNKMIYEIDIWSKLTDKEKDWVIEKQENWTDIIPALTELSPTKKMGGGTFNGTRSELVRSLVLMLETPPHSLDDSPSWASRVEKEYLGIPISYSEVDSCDTSAATATCKEFFEGVKGDVTLAVQIIDLKEYKLKKGQNKGRNMAFLTVEDGTGSIDNVTVFCDDWEKHDATLYEGNTVLLYGGRSGRAQANKGNDGFVVKKVVQI